MNFHRQINLIDAVTSVSALLAERQILSKLPDEDAIRFYKNHKIDSERDVQIIKQFIQGRYND